MLNCRLCKSKDIFVKYKVNDWKVGCCRKCGFWQVLEKPKNQELFEIYNTKYFKRGKYIIKDKATDLENKRRISWLKQNGLKKGARILDIGCATGGFIKMARNQFDTWGLDISEFAVERARLNNPGISQQIKAGRIEELKFPDNFFDCIVLWDVIEHLWDPLRTVSKLVKILKPGGMLTISTPNIGAPSAFLMGKHWHFMTLPEHLCFFNKNTINYLFKMTGLTPLNWMTQGKWVNLGFLLYKIKKTFPKLIPTNFVAWIQKKDNLAKIALYIPIGDVQYATAIRPK